MPSLVGNQCPYVMEFAQDELALGTECCEVRCRTPCIALGAVGIGGGCSGGGGRNSDQLAGARNNFFC